MTQPDWPQTLSKSPINIVIADDHPVMLVALRHAFTVSGFTVRATVSTVSEAVAEIIDPNIQIVVTDYAFGHAGDGLLLISRMRRHRPDLGIIVYSMLTSPPVITDIMMAGANAFVPKTKGTDDLMRACRKFLAKKRSETGEERVSHVEDGEGALRRLSPREREVMRLIARGMSVREIGAHLRRSPKTVSAQKCTAMAKLGLHGDLALARYLALKGWLNQ